MLDTAAYLARKFSLHAFWCSNHSFPYTVICKGDQVCLEGKDLISGIQWSKASTLDFCKQSNLSLNDKEDTSAHVYFELFSNNMGV